MLVFQKILRTYKIDKPQRFLVATKIQRIVILNYIEYEVNLRICYLLIYWISFNDACDCWLAGLSIWYDCESSSLLSKFNFVCEPLLVLKTTVVHNKSFYSVLSY